MREARQGTVLVLDDDPGVARLERLRLERAGFAVVSASTPEEGLHALEAGGIDVALLDYQLSGGVNGLDFLGQVRAAGHDVAAILVTGFGDEAMLARALRAGIRDFLPKTPDYLDFLAPTVARVLTQVETERALAARQRQLNVERHRSGQLQRLAAVSSSLNAALDVETVLDILSAEARGLIGAGRSIASLVPDGDWSRATHTVSPLGGTPDPTAIPAAAEAARGTGPRRVDRSAPDADRLLPPGSSGWLAVPLVGRNGRSMGLVQLFDKAGGPFNDDDEAIVVQLTRMASVAVENAWLYQELRENDRRKDEFLAMLAHELRNPLAAIDGAAQVSRQSGLEEHAAWAAEVIQRQCKQLSRLIEDLLDVSRINQGKIRLRRVPLDLAEAVDRALESVRPQVEAKGHRLEVVVGSEPLWVEADPSRIEQVLVNLLGNAAKYTPARGRIVLKARREGDEVVVEVADNGVGIAPEMLPKVFDQFIQVEQTLDRAQGGLGIGLSLVRRLVEMHGGSATAWSEGLGKGSAFTVRLPAITAPATAGDPGEHRSSALSAKRARRLLVVDDSVDTARAMARLLSASGCEVRVAHDGLVAVTMAHDFRPDVILLDIGLPSLDGYEVAAEIRRDPDLSGVVLIAVSGYGTERDRLRSLDAGFDLHLVKPVDFDVLFAHLGG